MKKEGNSFSQRSKSIIGQYSEMRSKSIVSQYSDVGLQSYIDKTIKEIKNIDVPGGAYSDNLPLYTPTKRSPPPRASPLLY
jgi:hypothetical protein